MSTFKFFSIKMGIAVVATITLGGISYILFSRESQPNLVRVTRGDIRDEVIVTGNTKPEASRLSGGQKQRVAIARALVNDPNVIFADEPTGNLDSKSGAQIMEILEDLHGTGRTIILVTHETYTAEFADRLIKLKDGEIESDELVIGKKHRHGSEFFK